MTQNSEPKHAVKQGVAYHTVDDVLTRNYVSLGGKRVYVFGAKLGDELTKAQAKKMAKPPKAAPAPVDNSTEE